MDKFLREVIPPGTTVFVNEAVTTPYFGTVSDQKEVTSCFQKFSVRMLARELDTLRREAILTKNNYFPCQ